MSINDPNKRPKGFIKWKPRAATVEVINQVNEVFAMYEANLPLTARQIFYRLVGAYDYEKTEKAYNRLCEYLVRARRANMIPFGYIRDDGTIRNMPLMFDSEDAWWRYTKKSAEHYWRDRTEGQPNIEVWCEAAGMAPQLYRVSQKYGVPVYSTGGFSSVTVTHQVAVRAMHEGRPTVFLHIGDYDPSGQSIFESMSEDIWTFVTQIRESPSYVDLDKEDVEYVDFIYKRVALTGAQVEEYNLPTAPPKQSDSRTANWIGETCQAEAMAPDDLAQVLEEAIVSEMDLVQYEAILREEEPERDALVAHVSKFLEEEGFEE